MSLSILLIEDDENTRKAIIEELRSNDIFDNILQAPDPVTGLELYHQNKDQISVLICDHYLPIQDGTQLCSIIKKERPGIKVIIYTGDTKLKNIVDTSCADLVLFKPDGIFELPFAVKKI